VTQEDQQTYRVEIATLEITLSGLKKSLELCTTRSQRVSLYEAQNTITNLLFIHRTVLGPDNLKARS
jgi:hypothetical protein